VCKSNLLSETRTRLRIAAFCLLENECPLATQLLAPISDITWAKHPTRLDRESWD
jgi:hypothetical protein